jgi:hypothetical protein
MASMDAPCPLGITHKISAAVLAAGVGLGICTGGTYSLMAPRPAILISNTTNCSDQAWPYFDSSCLAGTDGKTNDMACCRFRGHRVKVS